MKSCETPSIESKRKGRQEAEISSKRLLEDYTELTPNGHLHLHRYHIRLPSLSSSSPIAVGDEGAGR
jgi:hypothetical protein